MSPVGKKMLSYLFDGSTSEFSQTVRVANDRIAALTVAGKFVARRKGSYGRRIIRSYVEGGRRYELHATKGWRSYRA